MNKIIKMFSSALLVCIVFQLNGCVNESLVTMRPAYAYPQNLVSLCDNPTTLLVSNRGSFVTGDYTNKSSTLLLSAQLLPLEPAQQQPLTYLQLTVLDGNRLSIRAFDNDGKWYEYTVPSADLSCNQDGELLLHYPDDGFYFWASYGSKKRELALWSNSAGELVIHNRWLETQSGLVSGKVSGDAWGFFTTVEPVVEVGTATAAAINLNSLVQATEVNTECALLTGSYETAGEVLTPDGQFLQRSAVDQFFRAEIIGEHPVNQSGLLATHLVFQHAANGDVQIQLFNDAELLVSRTLAGKDLTCKQGRWFYEGEIKGESPWLLIIASGGVHWENLTLWQSQTGDLLLEGLFKSKGLLMLIPFGRTEKTFITYPKYKPEQ